VPAAGDPFAHLDDELRRLQAARALAAAHGEQATARRIAAAIDARLEERYGQTAAAPQLPRTVTFLGGTSCGEDGPGHAGLPEAAKRVHAFVAAMAQRHGLEYTGLRVRMSAVPPEQGGRVLAQVNASVAGRAMRIQCAAAGVHAVLGPLLARTDASLRAYIRGWRARPNPDPARARTLAPPLIYRADATITRVKTVRVAPCPVQLAAIAMDALDYDIHLFTDPATGHDAAICRTGPTGYALTRITPGAPPPSHPPGPPLTLDTCRVLWLTCTEAIGHLNATALPHLFFADPETSRGRVLYRRYDGDLALLSTPGPQLGPPQAVARAISAAGEATGVEQAGRRRRR
jgi:hypothetical protein